MEVNQYHHLLADNPDFRRAWHCVISWLSFQIIKCGAATTANSVLLVDVNINSIHCYILVIIQIPELVPCGKTNMLAEKKKKKVMDKNSYNVFHSALEKAVACWQSLPRRGRTRPFVSTWHLLRVNTHKKPMKNLSSRMGHQYGTKCSALAGFGCWLCGSRLPPQPGGVLLFMVLTTWGGIDEL